MYLFKKKNNEKENIKEEKNIKHNYIILYDRVLLWLTLGLSTIGLIMVLSASLPVGKTLYQDPFFFVKRQVLYFSIIFIISIFCLRIPIIFWKRNSGLILICSIFLLFSVLLIGHSIHGSYRWINLGLFHIQPSELCKFSSFCYISSYLSRKNNEINSHFWGLLKPIGIIAIESILLLLEPDLGAVIVLLFTTFSILFLAGVKIGRFLVIIFVNVTLIIIAILLKPYRIKRILSFLNPWQDPFGDGYQLTQSLMALGRGNFFGQGLGNSIHKLDYLPDAHSDFIFSIIGEELGYIGAFLILLMIFILSFRAMKIGKQALEKKRMFEGFLSCSIGIWFSFQTLINIGGVTGVLPIKGLTLPLISYGGSSLIINLISIFCLLRIDFELRLKTSQAFPRG